jgi:hypothetical protein
MKRIAVVLIFLLALTPSAYAAPKSLVMKKLDLLTSAQGAEGLLISGKTLITYLNTGGDNSNIVLTGLDPAGAQLWQKSIDSGADEIAMAGAIDNAGNLWLAGDSAPLTALDTTTIQLPPDNPDGVVAELPTPLRSDMNLLTLWKLSSTGELLATYSLVQTSPALVNAISVNATGVSLVGQLGDKPFAISVSSTGSFGKLLTVGTSKTQLSAVLRNLDGTMNVFGSSSETIAGKKVVGIRDGILLKINKAGVITTAIRSSATKAVRSWNYSDSSFTLTGPVTTGKKVESAFTKFTPALAPTWTVRVPSNGISLVATGGAITYAVLGSDSAIAGISGWKPNAYNLVLLTFDGKGTLTGGYSATELVSPTAIAYSKELGIYGLALASDGSVSIFHLAAR